jgi:hypothetical protein
VGSKESEKGNTVMPENAMHREPANDMALRRLEEQRQAETGAARDISWYDKGE